VSESEREREREREEERATGKISNKYSRRLVPRARAYLRQTPDAILESIYNASSLFILL
jgi:hypothetical protein